MCIRDSNTVKDLVRVGATSAEFIAKYVTGQPVEDQAITLFDVLLAREPEAGGLATFTNYIRVEGWINAVDYTLLSAEYTVHVRIGSLLLDSHKGRGDF